MDNPELDQEILELLPALQQMEAGDDLGRALQPLEDLGNTYFECRHFLVLKRDGEGHLRGGGEHLEIDIPAERLMDHQNMRSCRTHEKRFE